MGEHFQWLGGKLVSIAIEVVLAAAGLPMSGDR